MPDAPGPRVKICGLVRREDATAADRFGADFLGVVLSAGFRRSVDPAASPGVLEGVRATPVAVLVDEPAERAIELATALGAGVVQLHGDEAPSVVRAVADGGPWQVWKAVRPADPGQLDRAAETYAVVADGLLVEGYREGVVGGGGVTLDLDGFAEARSRLPAELRLILAGGLTPESVGPVVARFFPDVVDVSSGVERVPGRKDEELVRRFIAEARRAARSVGGPRTVKGETP